MGNMTTRPIASAAERISAATYLWGHTGAGPAADRRVAITDIVTRDASGNVPGPLSIGNGAFSIGGTRLSITDSGNAYLSIYGGAGSTNGGFLLGGNNAENFANLFWNTAANYTQIGTTPVGSSVVFNIAGSERARVDSVGLRPGADNAQALGTASFRWSVVYAATGTINTSDKRQKTEISEIPDEWLDAWADVQWCRFKMIDRVRWHVGLVAQDIHAAFAAHDLDAFEIGLCCYNEWEEQREPIYEMVTKTRMAKRIEHVPAGENEQGEPLFTLQIVEFEEEYQDSVDTGKFDVKPAGDVWGLRYDECEAMEAAWQRRELARMAARLAALEGT